MTLEFKVATRRKDPIKFTLEGDDYVYSAVPAKRARMALAFLDDDHTDSDGVRDMFDWLGRSVGEDGMKRIIERLEDEDDDLDVDALQTIAEGLLKETSGRPTT